MNEVEPVQLIVATFMLVVVLSPAAWQVWRAAKTRMGRDEFLRRLYGDRERSDYPLVYRQGHFTVTIRKDTATIDDGIAETFSYDSVYLVSLRCNPHSDMAFWTVHCSPESPREVTLPAVERSEGSLAMHIVAYKAKVEVEKLEY